MCTQTPLVCVFKLGKGRMLMHEAAPCDHARGKVAWFTLIALLGAPKALGLLLVHS